MKKILKSRIFLVIITIILTLGTTVFGTILYQANQVGYTPSDATWSVTSVDEALNDLYSTANTKFTNFKSTIAQAITNKGVETSATDSAETMATNINNIVVDPGQALTKQTKSVQVSTSAFANGYYYSCSGTITFDFPNRVVGAVNPNGHSGYGGITSISGNTVKFGYSGFGRGDNRPNTPWTETITITAEGY